MRKVYQRVQHLSSGLKKNSYDDNVGGTVWSEAALLPYLGHFYAR